jgi:hypothetical protein
MPPHGTGPAGRRHPARTISTSGISGLGLKKCMPTTRCGRSVTDAIRAILLTRGERPRRDPLATRCGIVTLGPRLQAQERLEQTQAGCDSEPEVHHTFFIGRIGRNYTCPCG